MTTTKEIGRMARHVCEEHEMHNTAIAQVREAGVRVLEEILEAVRPALPALSNRLQGTDLRGLVVVAQLHGIRQRSLVLTPQSDFWRLDEPEVIASHVQMFAGWKETRLTLAEVVAERWNLSTIADSIAEALEGQLDGRKLQSVEVIAQQAKRLGAVATLLRAARGA